MLLQRFAAALSRTLHPTRFKFLAALGPPLFVNSCLCNLKYFPKSTACFSCRFSTKISIAIYHSTMRDFKCSKKTLNHVDIGLIQDSLQMIFLSFLSLKFSNLIVNKNCPYPGHGMSCAGHALKQPKTQFKGKNL